MQKINENVDFQLEYAESEEDSFNDRYLSIFIRPFKLTEAPLFRAMLISFPGYRYALMMDMHHIISDRASMIILTREFAELYEGKKLVDLQIQYKDYVVWQRNLLESNELKRQENYWLSNYSDSIPSTVLKTDYKKDRIKDFEGKLEFYKFDEGMKDKIMLFSSSAGVTRNMVLFAIYNVLLWRWTGSEDISVGTSILGRNSNELENVLGMFVNTLSIRNYPHGDKTFIEFLTEVKESLLNAYANQDYPYEILVKRLSERFKKNVGTLFNSMFIMQNQDYPELKIKDITAKPYYIASNIRFDLQFDAIEANNGDLSFCFTYSEELYKKETIQTLVSNYLKILSKAIEKPERKLKEFLE